ncbi:hypothetical protein PY479_07665 [Shewanella sp. A32]|uniref:hypothetical protein n=1 Tax=Shewanella sp. A32 TaxID=3031327 RepID=UPI0023B9D3F0|nr:hypothetical protein [Shewanella sp. A32]MDF0534150.1 hypothetical protein [Shewanella sp. A32]
MKYMDGKQIEVGDNVLISGMYKGLVVADIDGDRYSADYPREQWGCLQTGVMIDTDIGGLVHYEQISLENEKIELVSRA